MDNTVFKSAKVSRSASFNVHGNVARIFPLFGAFEERKWVEGWNPVLIYPDAEVIEEGTTFTTSGKGDESVYLWRVIIYDPGKHTVRYLISTENRYWTIHVTCLANADVPMTTVHVMYTYIGLNAKGNAFNARDAAAMYANDLRDWAEAIDNFLLQA